MTTDVQDQIAQIKKYMPETYKSIQAKASEIGKPAYGLVRRALKGEPNCFFAVERERVAGTPFLRLQGVDKLAKLIEQFGCPYVCMWAESTIPTQEAANGAH